MSGSFLDLLSDLDRSDLLGLGRPGPRTFRRGASIVVQGDDTTKPCWFCYTLTFRGRSRNWLSLIASSPESIVRSLRSLRAHRLVTTGRRRITIRDLDGLLREANGQ
jgi:hypothetical protein